MNNYLSSPNIDEFDKDENGDLLDPVTFDPIPEHLLVKLWSGKTAVCFNVDTLYKTYVDGDYSDPVNPFTKQELPEKVKTRVLQYESVTQLNVKCLVGLKEVEFKFPYYKHVGELIAKTIDVVSKELGESEYLVLRLNICLDSGISLYSLDLESRVNRGVSLLLKDFSSIKEEKDSLDNMLTYMQYRTNDPGTNHYHLYLTIGEILEEYIIVLTILLDKDIFESIRFVTRNVNITYINILKDYYSMSDYSLDYLLEFVADVVDADTRENIPINDLNEYIEFQDKSVEIILHREKKYYKRYAWFSKLSSYMQSLLDNGIEPDEVDLAIGEIAKSTMNVKKALQF